MENTKIIKQSFIIDDVQKSNTVLSDEIYNQKSIINDVQQNFTFFSTEIINKQLDKNNLEDLSEKEFKNNTSTEESDDTSEESTSSDEILDHNNNLNLSGQKLKNYNIIYELGRGSYSIVWLAYCIIDKKFYAIKVQDSHEFKNGLQEIKFVQRLPKNPPVFNNLIKYFIEHKQNKKYLCSVWNLHYFNLDTLIRKSNYNNGLPLYTVKYIMKQLISAILILHKKFKVFHGDIKTDNILIKGINNRDQFICNKYVDNININDQNNSNEYHENITKLIIKELENYNITNSENDLIINNKFIETLNISLADFGTHCNENNYYTNTFGTRYYQAPEIILLGNCSYPVDIWALGCTLYELLSGEILFNPIKDSKWSRDYYHLCLINDTCGIFPYNFIKKTKKYKDFFKFNKIIDHKYSHENRLNKKIENLQLDNKDKIIIKELLIDMLTIDPKKRCTIDYINVHPFFN